MGRHDDFDDELAGQMTIEDLFSPPEQMVAVSNIFARARKQMSLAEQKTFVLALTQLKYLVTPTEQSNVVHLNKKVLGNVLGLKSDSTDISGNIWREIKCLPQHSYIEIEDKDKGLYTSGSVIATVTRRSNWDYYRVKFEEDYFPLFTGLGEKYISMWSSDIFGMENIRSVQFYELLRQRSYDMYEEKSGVYSFGFGIKTFKEMFDIPKEGKGSYMREKDGFDRANFEKRVIEPLCRDMAKCRMIQLVMQENGKYYEKVKEGNRVKGYRFYWTISMYPAVATASEVKGLQERVDGNPSVLKVAKDIVKGEKKPKAKEKPNKFINLEQREIDYDKLVNEKTLARMKTAKTEEKKP